MLHVTEVPTREGAWGLCPLTHAWKRVTGSDSWAVLLGLGEEDGPWAPLSCPSGQTGTGPSHLLVPLGLRLNLSHFVLGSLSWSQGLWAVPPEGLL